MFNLLKKQVKKIKLLKITFIKKEEQLSSLISKLKFFNSLEKLKKAIVDVVITDPRSIHLKKKYGYLFFIFD